MRKGWHGIVWCLSVMLLFGALALAEEQTSTLSAVHWSDGYQRWRDIATNPYSSGVVDPNYYNGANVWIDYSATSPTFAGTLHALGLKPNFAYQLKLNGKPKRLVAASDVGWLDGQCDDAANERLGYAGRWYWKKVSRATGAVVGESGALTVSDAEYEARKEQGFLDTDYWYCFEGYVLFDWIVTDPTGAAVQPLWLDSSYHVLWSSMQGSPGAGDSEMRWFWVNPSASPLGWYPSPTPDACSIGMFAEGQSGRPAPGSLQLPNGLYNVRIFLTEEDFHATMAWTTVMACDTVQFTVESSPPPPAVKRWAVICGVSNYKKLNDLSYCDDDARDIAAALRQFPEWQGADQIEVLVDSAASKAGVQAAINRMAGKANADTTDHDVCLFFFSGHGMQVSDNSGDETDGRDEAICAWDTQFKGNYVTNVITDDELGSWLGSLPGNADVVTILDTCFSGGMAKGVPGAQVKTVPNPFLPGNAKAKVGFGKGLAKQLAKGRPAPGPTGSSDVGGGNAVVLMACEEGGLSYETPALQNGVFSYYVIQGIGGLTAVPGDGNHDGLLAAEEDFAYARPLTTTYAQSQLGVRQVPQLYDGDAAAEAVILTTTPPVPVHDVAVTGIVAPASVTQGAVVDVVVTVANEGNGAETFDVTLTDTTTGTPIGTQTATGLAADASTDLTFHWNTAGATTGPHTLRAAAPAVPGETDLGDNSKSTNVSVNEQGSAVVRVASIAMGIASAGKNWKATALVTVVDQSGGPAGGATVAADWSLDGAYIGSSSGVTDGQGQVSLSSPPKKAKSGQVFRIDITGVTKAGYEYDATGSTTTKEIIVP